MLSTQLRILAIDTDRDAVRVLAAQLHPLGAATGAVSPADAVAGVVRFSPNLVTVAADLAGKPGTEVVAALSRDPRSLHLPVVLLTAKPRGDELLQALRAGAADYFVLPLRPEVELPELLRLAQTRNAPGVPGAAPAAERLVRILGRLQLTTELTTGEPGASARFEAGQLVSARCDALSGEAAVEALIATPEASFRPPPSAVPAAVEVRPGTLELELDMEIDVEEPPPAPATPPRCLLVDDEPDLLKLFSAFLKRAGFEVATAADGVQGYEACVAQRPDIVVADLNMPHLDGWGLLRKIRSDVRVAETPVVFLSAQDDYRESLRAVGAGAQDDLAKASKMDVLARRVRVALEPRERAMAAIAARQGVHGRIEQLGVRWLLGELARARASGTVALADGLGIYNVGLVDGAATFLATQQGPKRISGEAALPLLVQLRDGDAQFLPGQLPQTKNLAAAQLAAALEQVAAAAHQAEADALEALMVRAAQVEVDGGVFTLYERFCPPFGREVARFIRAGKTPKQILAESALNPLEVVETLRDMVRRQVIRLKA
jgi:DNA-binding response OmpR family regulator